MKRLFKMIVTLMMLFCASMNVLAEDIDFTDINASGFYSDGETLYVVDDYSNMIYQYDGKTLTFIAGNENLIANIPQGGLVNGKVEYSLFDDPFMALSWNGGIIVSDTQNNMLRFIKDGLSSTYAGDRVSGYVNGNVETSLFYLPNGLAIDDDGNLLVADTGNGAIRKITIDGEVSTYIDGLNAPVGICWDNGSLYITDIETNQILKVTNNEISVVAGVAMQVEDEWIAGFSDGTILEATFNCPQGIYVEDGVIYIADTGNGAIRRIYEGEVETIYQSDLLIMPTGVIIYDNQLMIGDSFSRNFVSISSGEAIPEEVQVQKSEEALDAYNPNNQQIEGFIDGSNLIFMIIGSVVIVVAILAIYFIKKKKSSDKKTKA
ncbi:MAG: hypothetical protein R3Y57_01090 [Erysipelotrichaceae bacterium]